MEQAFHAARLVAAHDALLALLAEYNAGASIPADSIAARLTDETFDSPAGFDITYMADGQPLAGEGV